MRDPRLPKSSFPTAQIRQAEAASRARRVPTGRRACITLLPEAPARRLQLFPLKRRGFVSMVRSLDVSNSAQTSPWIGRNFKQKLGHYRSFTILIRINVTGTGFAVCEGRHEKMPAHHRRMAIALMTRWFEHVQVGGAFNDTILAIFSEDSPLGRFADAPTTSASSTQRIFGF